MENDAEGAHKVLQKACLICGQAITKEHTVRVVTGPAHDYCATDRRVNALVEQDRERLVEMEPLPLEYPPGQRPATLDDVGDMALEAVCDHHALMGAFKVLLVAVREGRPELADVAEWVLSKCHTMDKKFPPHFVEKVITNGLIQTRK